MNPVIIFQHYPGEGPGYLQRVLDRHGITSHMVYIDQNEPVPESIEPYSALVFMGGPMSVNDDLPWIEPELRLIRAAAAQKMPVLGHCLGGQLICKALGGRVAPNPVKEIGWLAVEKVDNPPCEDWLSGVAHSFEAFHWHGETFSIPQGASHVLRSGHCEHQGFVLDNILALQCHIEMEAPMVREWAGLYRDQLQSPDPTVQSADVMMEKLESKITALQANADVIYRRWLQPLLG
jgi:GMP synthase-like glutamine amidotransferase